MKKYISFLSFLTLFSLSIIAQHAYNRRGVHFDTVVDFANVTFETAALFDTAQFDSSAIFTNCGFKSYAYFVGTQFKSTAIFDGAHFYTKSTNFTNTHFNSSVSFHYAKFDDYAVFTGAKFLSNAYFGATRFMSTALFRHAIFSGTVNFEFATFYKRADFVLVKFNSVANFNSAQFYSKSSFRDAILPYYLDLSNVIIDEEEIDLTVALINPKFGVCKINLVNANINKITFRYYSKFELYFPDGTGIETKTTVYEKLLLKQKKEGFIKSYEKLDKEYKEFWYLEGGGLWKPWGYFQNFLSKYWWGYGYNKIYIVYNTILLFLIFTLINSFWLDQVLAVYKIPKLNKMKDEMTSITSDGFSLFWKRVQFSAFYTGLVFFGVKFSLNNLNYKENLTGFRKWRLIYFFIVYITGLVCLGYLANFVLSN